MMGAKRFILVVGSLAILYTIVVLFLKMDQRRIRGGDMEPIDLNADIPMLFNEDINERSYVVHHSIPRVTSTAPTTTVTMKGSSQWQYNLTLAPEWYALRRPLEDSKVNIPILDESTISRLEADARRANEQGEAVKRFPTTLIIGVRKAGTRALLAILNIHPQVKSCGPEVHFFDQRYPRGLLWYLDQTPKITQEQQTIEKTPSYFVVQDVPKRILAYSKAINKTLKLLVIFRDPSIRAISDYVQLNLGVKAKYDKPLQPFEQIVVKNHTTGIINTAWGVVKTGVYSKHLERWLRYFPRNWFHFVSGEELVKNPYKEIKMVEQFLGLKPYFKKENFVFNPTKGFPCFRVENGNLRCLGKAKGRTHPIVDERTMCELRRYYLPFNEKLYNMTNRNFHWP